MARKVLALMASLALTVTMFAGCANQTPNSSTSDTPSPEAPVSSAVASSDAETITLGFASNISDENQNELVASFQRYCEEWNAAGKTPKLETAVTVAESSVDKQIADVESLIQMKCSAIVLHSVDLEGLKPAVDACAAAGIPAIECRGMEYDKVSVNFNYCDEAMMAQMAFDWYKKQLDADPELVLNMGLIYGMASQSQQLVRVDHLIELLKAEYPDRVNVLASQPCDWDTQKAMECMENWLQRFDGQMNCIVAAGAMMGVGAANSIVAAGGSMDDWLITTTDATSDVLYSINAGVVDMTVGIDVTATGLLTGETARKLVMGEIQPGPMDVGGDILVPIDSSNIADWYKEG